MTILDTELDRELMSCIVENAKGYSKHCARNAISHLEKAWEIRHIDKEMAVFRSITAEEEAATAIFVSLKEKGYDNARKIKFKQHAYKQALEPFTRSIGSFFKKMATLPDFPFEENYRLKISGEGKDRKILLCFPRGQYTLEPDPPLGFEVKRNEKIYCFEEELLEISKGKNREEVIRYVNDISNLRNEILYAQNDGIPSIDNDIDEYLNNKKTVVITFLRIYGLIYPHKKKALFVQQALNAYLEMMGEIETGFE